MAQNPHDPSSGLHTDQDPDTKSDLLSYAYNYGVAHAYRSLGKPVAVTYAYANGDEYVFTDSHSDSNSYHISYSNRYHPS